MAKKFCQESWKTISYDWVTAYLKRFGIIHDIAEPDYRFSLEDYNEELRLLSGLRS